MIILDILKFASSSFVNFLITTFLLSIVAWGVANFRLVEVTLIHGDNYDQLTTETENKEDD